MLISATEISDRLIDAGGLDADEAHGSVRALTFLPFIEDAKTVSKAREIDAINVPLYRVLKGQSLFLAVSVTNPIP